jgi:hypothetical protein
MQRARVVAGAARRDNPGGSQSKGPIMRNAVRNARQRAQTWEKPVGAAPPPRPAARAEAAPEAQETPDRPAKEAA